MAPVYDTGNCLFYNEDPVPVKSGLLNVKVNSFCKKETDMLSYVKNKEVIDIEKLEGFPKEVEELLKQYTKMPEERAEKIAETDTEKDRISSVFQEGKKIWKTRKILVRGIGYETEGWKVQRRDGRR